MKIVLMVNDQKSCNIDCGHCYLPYAGNRSPEDTLEAVINLKAQGHDVIIAGSETLVDTGYLEAYMEAGQDYLLTNGILLNHKPELFDLIEEHGIKTIQISAHFGIDKELKSVPISLVGKVATEAKYRGFDVRLATTITSKNYHDVENMCGLAYGMGADELKFIRMIQSGKAEADNENSLTQENINMFFDYVTRTRAKYDKDEFRISMHGNFGPRPGSAGESLSLRNGYCPASDGLVAIAPDGVVYGCPFLMNIPIGRYVEGRLDMKSIFQDRLACLAK
ncbi:MAG: radical SAM protein [Nanoarchaeota archaeon]|nr:radical SAM protein [Nanoarchaeota archaeon]